MLINSPSLRRAALACTLSVFACSASFAQIVAGPAKPTVYNNPQQPNDPRVGLKGGITDAGVAALGMELVVNLPKPTGFAAGTTPRTRPLRRPRRHRFPARHRPSSARWIVRLHQLRPGLQRQPRLRRQL